MYNLKFIASLVGLFFLTAALGREMSVDLLTQDGSAIKIATLQIQDENAAEKTFQLQLNDSVFTEHFLSMRPFRCLQGPAHMLCHLSYPYQNNRLLSKQHVRDLEYDLLFIRKDPKEFGIDAWNGLYYKLQWQQDRLKGTLHEVDLNILAVPPAAGDLYPIGDNDLTPADPASHWLPTLFIH